MRPITYLILIALTLGFASSAFAETKPSTDPRGPMRYTKIQDAPTTDDSAIKLRTIKHEDPKADKKEEEPSQTRIWNKYKALASGQTEEERLAAEKAAKETEAKKSEKDDDKKSAKKEDKDEDEDKEAKAQSEEEPAKPSGIAALIDEYKKNKAKRSQMHSISVTKPAEAAELEKAKTND